LLHFSVNGSHSAAQPSLQTVGTPLVHDAPALEQHAAVSADPASSVIICEHWAFIAVLSTRPDPGCAATW
jgi:hypothetical protein